MKIEQLINEWIATYVNRKYSETTVKNYRSGMRHFESFLVLTSINSIRDVTLDHLNQYRLYLTDKKFSARTIVLCLSYVRFFFKFLEENQHIFDNPAKDLMQPKCNQKLMQVPKQKDIVKLLMQPDINTLKGIRDRALMECAYSTGIRLGELYQLSIFDLDIKKRTLQVIGKGDKERVVPMGKQAVFWLKHYMEKVRPILVKSKTEEALWISQVTGKRISYPQISKIVREYGKAAKIKYPITVHSLRRACATHMLRNGAHPVHLQMLLGHSDMTSLSQYLKVTIKDMKKMHKRSKPGK